MTFKRMLPRLVAAYDQGMLVPFLGAGMSLNLCPDWHEMVLQLHGEKPWPRDANGSVADADRPPRPESSHLIQSANKAVRELSLQNPSQLTERLRVALYSASGRYNHQSEWSKRIPQTAALAGIWWPIVVSTNYDDLFAKAYQSAHANDDKIRRISTTKADRKNSHTADYGPHIRVLGRSREDCADLLSALSITVPTVLWAIHGHLASVPSKALEPLEAELVVGHDEYRRLAHADPIYRRTFAELWRRKSLFFLGSSLGDPHLLDLFSEIQEIYGTNPQPHFALVGPNSGVDVELLRSRFNIFVVEMAHFGELEDNLKLLSETINSVRPRAMQWGWHYHAHSSECDLSRGFDLEIVNCALPTQTASGDKTKSGDTRSIPIAPAGEGLLVSAGFFYGQNADADPLFFSPRIRNAIMAFDNHFVKLAESGTVKNQGQFYTHVNSKVAAIRPWASEASRDIRLIPRLLGDAFAWAEKNNIQHLRMPLLGGGKSRHFPPAVILSMIVREHRSWRSDLDHTLRITIHLIDRDARFELTSGRLNISELVNAEDLRLWIKVRGSRHVPVEPIIVPEKTTLKGLAKTIQLPNPHTDWEAFVSPAATVDDSSIDIDKEDTLADLGVISGGSITFQHKNDTRRA